MKFTELKYTVSFNTPAFLGNAEQQAQWRTPPFKALLRQWWRVVKAPDLNYSVAQLRKAEGELFGYASDSSDDTEEQRNKDRPKSRQSRLKLRMKDWAPGLLDNDKWPRTEIKGISVGEGPSIPADVYLGFGPILPASKKENRASPSLGRKAIDPERATNELRLSFARDISEGQVQEVRKAVALACWFGGIGSRSRNGWGSIKFSGDNLPPLPKTIDEVSSWLRPLESCFGLDWPHAIGSDRSGPFIWIGKPLRNWREAVFSLATARRQIRSAAKTFGRGEDISANQLIAYPVTQSNNRAWESGREGSERMPSSLRLKVVKNDQGLVPVAIHLPCAVPKRLLEKLSTADQAWVKEHQIGIWQSVHKMLDDSMQRFGGAA